MTVSYDARMDRIWHHHDDWEDHAAGMFALTCGRADGSECAARLLANPPRLHEAMSLVVSEWVYASEHNLSNQSQNRQAWLGQAACCLVYGVPDDVTKLGWHMLTEGQQSAANAVADQVIAAWESSHDARLF